MIIICKINIYIAAFRRKDGYLLEENESRRVDCIEIII